MPKEKFLKSVILIILIICVLFSLTGCGKKQSKEELSKQKLDQEIQYLDTKFVSLMNMLNNISFSNYKVTSEEVKEDKDESKGNSSESEQSDSKSFSEGGASSESEGNSDSNSNSNSSSESKEESSSGGDGKEQNKIFKLTEDNILSSDPNVDIAWDLIKSEIENLYSIWTTITIDMHTAGVNSDDILEFNTLLDSLGVQAKDENKQGSLENLSKLYNLLPKYLNSYSNDEIKKSVLNTKAHLLTAFSIVDTDRWEDMHVEILKANQEFSTIINNVNIDKNKKLNVNRAYLLLKEAQNSIETKDKDIFLIKYKNTIQELNML